MEGGIVDHHWDPTWLHQGEYVIQLQQPHQQWRTMCPLWWGRSGDKNQKPPLMEAKPQSGAQINTQNQAANSYDNSRVSERKHFVKQTVCCLIAVFSHLRSLSQQLSLMWRGSGLSCSGHCFLVIFYFIKIVNLGKTHTEKRGQTSCMHVWWQSFALEKCPFLKETCNDAFEMMPQPILLMFCL